jgi:hypothetical protein
VTCRKSSDEKKQLFSCFRKRLREKLGTDDSFTLIPLEGWLGKVFDYCKNLGSLDEMISRTAICHPYIPLAFLEECIDLCLVKESDVEGRVSLLNHLIKKEFHKRVFSLWMKSKKNAGEVEKDFDKFTSRLESLILNILCDEGGYAERLDYIVNLDPEDIEIFDLSVVLWEAKKVFNMGVKQFHKQDFSGALDLFSKSSRMNPSNPFIHWNMARLGCILGHEKNGVMDYYNRALELTGNSKNRKEIEKERLYVKENKDNLIPREPALENHQIFKCDRAN